MYLSSVAFLPEWDFDGRRLQDLSFIMSISRFAFQLGQQMTALPLCSAGMSPRMIFVLFQTLSATRTTVCPIEFCLWLSRFPENVVFRGDWWESISEPDRQRIVDRALSGVGNGIGKRLFS